MTSHRSVGFWQRVLTFVQQDTTRQVSSLTHHVDDSGGQAMQVIGIACDAATGSSGLFKMETYFSSFGKCVTYCGPAPRPTKIRAATGTESTATLSSQFKPLMPHINDTFSPLNWGECMLPKKVAGNCILGA